MKMAKVPGLYQSVFFKGTLLTPSIILFLHAPGLDETPPIKSLFTGDFYTKSA